MKKIIFTASLMLVYLNADMLPEYEVAPSFTKAITEGNSKIDNYDMVGLSLSKKISEDFMLNLSYAKGDTDYKKSNISTDIEVGFLNAQYYFYKQNNLFTYATAGVGYQHFDKKFNSRDSGVKLNYGAGVKYYFNDVVNIFAQVTHLTDFSDDENEMHLTTGIGFVFGKAVKEPVKTTSYTPQIEEKKAQSKPTHQPKPKKVVDSDKDLVIDTHDMCPNTPQGFKVDKNGCEISYNFQVHFAFDSSILQAKALKRIDAFAHFIDVNKEAIKQIEIAGHTDAKGSNEYNLSLSQRRAKAVYDTLVDKGISQKLMIYKGYGEEKPLVSNDSEENRALNRRVEANLIRK